MLRDPGNVERKFLHNVLGPDAGKVLEIGCGDGRLTAELLSISDTILALDPDADSMEKARHLLKSGVRLVLGSGENLPLAGNIIDTVIFSLSLHHHPDPGNALTQAQRVLKEGGRILVLEPGAESDINRCFRIIHDEDDAYDRAVEALERCGARLERQGSFVSTCVFDDFQEMVEYFYSYYDLVAEESQVSAMRDVVGIRTKDRPLEMEESTRWWLLTSISST